MPKTTSFILGDHFDKFVSDEVGEGRYASSSEVIRAGLRLLEERKRRIEALNEALIAGEQSGPGEPFDFDLFIERKNREHAARKVARK